MELLRISGKRLGYLAQQDACHRCFWIQSHLGWRLPWSFFPGVFSSLDSYTKRVTGVHAQIRQSLPKWLKLDGEPAAVPHHSQFRLIVKSSGLLLTGACDELIRRPDGSLVILDYKTSRFTSHQDELLPTYTAQLNAYSLIAEGLGMGPVSGLYLVYYEPLTGIQDESLLRLVDDDGFKMSFGAHVVPVPCQLTSLMALMKQARRIFDLTTPPPPQNGCKDCDRMAEMVGLMTGRRVLVSTCRKRTLARTHKAA